MTRIVAFLVTGLIVCTAVGFSGGYLAAQSANNTGAAQPAPRRVTSSAREPGTERPTSRDEVKSRIVGALLDLLDEINTDGSDEERKLIKEILFEADDELSRSLGKNSVITIMKHNNFQNQRRGTFVRPEDFQSQPTNTARAAAAPLETQESATPPPATAPSPNPQPADPFDNLFE